MTNFLYQVIRLMIIKLLKTSSIPKFGKYLVQNFNEGILITVYEVLELVDSSYGTIVIAQTNLEGSWENQCFFLNEALERNFIFSDDEIYKSWVNK